MPLTPKASAYFLIHIYLTPFTLSAILNEVIQNVMKMPTSSTYKIFVVMLEI